MAADMVAGSAVRSVSKVHRRTSDWWGCRQWIALAKWFNLGYGNADNANVVDAW